MKMRRLAPIVAAAVLASAPAMAEGGTIKIGIAASLTGSLAAYSESEGARCMADKINKAAGAGGPRIEVLVEDNRSDAQLSVSLGQKFLDAGAQVIAGYPFPDALIPMSKMAESYGATVYSAPNTQVEMQEVGLDNFIAGAVPDPINAAATAEVVYAKGGRKAVLLTSEDAGSWSAKLPVWFGEAFTSWGGKVVGKLNYSFGITDWSPQIASIKALPEKPDVVDVCGVLPDVGILIRQLRANGYDGWVVGCDGLDDPSMEQTVG
jgi:branched-chain amino acid transport system substrate-binding protein